MFTFTDHYTFEWPVKVKLPANGGEDYQEFDGIFAMPEDEMEIFEGSPETDIDMRGLVNFSRERLAKYWIGWKGIVTPGGDGLPFSPENRARLLKERPIRLAVDAALSDAILGVREKN